VDALCPVQFFNKRCCREKLAGGSIEYVDVAISVRLHQKFASFALERRVNQDWSLHRVVVEQVVRGELEMPFQLSGIRVKCQHTVGVEVISRTDLSVKIWSRIACAPINRVEFGVIRTGH